MTRRCWSVVALLIGLTALPAQAVWSETPTTVRPAPRQNHAAAYDPARGRLVMFGGMSGSTVFGDTWEFDGVFWRQAVPAVSPPARNAHVMAFDYGRSRVLLFGGSPDAVLTQSLNDTWEWDGVTWTRSAPATSPAPRLGLAMTFDFARGRVVLWGGRDSSIQFFSDTWDWDGSNWNLITNVGPPGRCCFDLAFDMIRGRLVLFGGWSGPTLDDTWEWDGSTWTRIMVTGPGTRWGHRMTYDIGRRVVVLHGGIINGGETWEWDGQNWTLAATTTAATRVNQVMAFDWRLLRPTLSGGSVNNVMIDDVWTYGVPVPPSVVPFGAGCPGSRGLPSLQVAPGLLPSIGRVFTLRAANVPGLTLFAFGMSNALYGTTPLPLDLTSLGMPGCWLHASPDATFGVTAPAGTASLTTTVPFAPPLIGVIFYSQALALDLSANTLGFTTSNALACSIGRP